MAPGFRSRITTGLLVAAAALPVPLATTATAAEQRNTPFDRPPHLVGRHALPDSHAQDPSLAGSLAGEGRGHPGRPESLGYPPGFPRPDTDMDVPDFPGLRDFLAEIPDEMPRYPDDPPDYLPWHDRHHGLDPDSDSSTAPDDDFADPADPGGAELDPPEDAPDEDDADRPAAPDETSPDPRSADPAPAPSRAAPSQAAPSRPAPDRPAPSRPSPSPRSDVAGRLHHRPYEPLQPPAKPKRDRTPPDDADADPAASTSPYAMDGPTAPVERVLPMGAGLALTGLGLAFLGLRLRRR
ncbi:hypothetical protein ACIRPT_22070 [Streptomyces sp. NPDC101227]|uniref:hypothetical protein n=1 Tax=Streptomyces sp. NPDC101227 TaxID=3366136 RepID=UPI0037FE026F